MLAIIIFTAIQAVMWAYAHKWVNETQQQIDIDSGANDQWHYWFTGYHVAKVFTIFITLHQLTDLDIYTILLLTVIWISSMFFIFENVHNYLRGQKLWHRGINEPKIIYKNQKLLWVLAMIFYSINVYLLLK